jgi:beta-galactosidase
MLANLGLELKDIPFNTRRAFAADGSLERALKLKDSKIPRFQDSKIQGFKDSSNREILESWNHGIMESLNHGILESLNDEIIPIQSDMQGFFNLSGLPGVQREDRTVYVSFWIFSPRSLVNLLVEPDMPKLNMTVEGQTETSTYINGVATTMNGRKLENMPLEEGWNHILMRFEKPQQSRNWRVKVQLDSDNQAFFQQVKSSVAMP